MRPARRVHFIGNDAQLPIHIAHYAVGERRIAHQRSQPAGQKRVAAADMRIERAELRERDRLREYERE